MPNFNLKWRKTTAPYEVIAIVPIGTSFLNVRISGSQFQVKSFQGAWYAIFVIGTDAAPQLAIGAPGDPRLDDNYQIAGTNCLQLKNFDTGTFFTIVGYMDPPVHAFLPVGVLEDPNNSTDDSTTPATYTIINITTSDYCAPWIFDDEIGGLSLAWVCPAAPAGVYRADTTFLTADSTTYTADYDY